MTGNENIIDDRLNKIYYIKKWNISLNINFYLILLAFALDCIPLYCFKNTEIYIFLQYMENDLQ